VTSFVAVSPPIGPLEYTIGRNGFETGPYQFVQSPDCGYATTITVTNLPPEPFIVHNRDRRTFTLSQTTDQSLIGVYLVTVRAEFF